MSFERAFHDVIRKPLRKTGLDRSQIRTRANGGQLAASDGRIAALSGAFLYMRGHADCLVTSLHKVATQEVFEGDLLLIDTGCGAGGAAIAVNEYLTENHIDGRIAHYIGIDHSEAARDLCTRMLTYPGVMPADTDAVVVDSLQNAKRRARNRVPKADNVLFTYSYFFKQKSVTDAVAVECADLVAFCADLAQGVTVVSSTDVTGALHDGYLAFRTRIRSLCAVSNARSHDFVHQNRFPNDLSASTLAFNPGGQRPGNNAVRRSMTVASQ